MVSRSPARKWTRGRCRPRCNHLPANRVLGCLGRCRSPERFGAASRRQSVRRVLLLRGHLVCDAGESCACCGCTGSEGEADPRQQAARAASTACRDQKRLGRRTTPESAGSNRDPFRNPRCASQHCHSRPRTKANADHNGFETFLKRRQRGSRNAGLAAACLVFHGCKTGQARKIQVASSEHWASPPPRTKPGAELLGGPSALLRSDRPTGRPKISLRRVVPDADGELTVGGTIHGPKLGRPRGAPSSRLCEVRTGPSRRHKRPFAYRAPHGSSCRSAAPRSLRSDLCPGSSRFAPSKTCGGSNRAVIVWTK